VAQRVAAAEPERVSRLVLASTWAAPPPSFLHALRVSIDLVEGGTWGEALRPELLPNFSPSRRDGPLPDRLLAMLERIGPAVLVAQAEAMLAAPDVTGAHRLITAPTLVLAADADVFFSVAQQRAIATSLVACDRTTVGFEVVQDSNHNMSLEQPERFVAAVRRWCLDDRVRGVEPASGRRSASPGSS
jgi:pimeloyl-ACP methyl ester carboxylesterase